MLIWLAFSLVSEIHAIVSFDDAEDECMDKSPYCTANDCKVRPGYAFEYCRKTCGNCEPFCYDSRIVSCKNSRKQECDSMLKDYCPLLCGVCRVKKKKYMKRKEVVIASKSSGKRTMSNPSLSIARLGILQKFSTSKLSRSDSLVKNTTAVVPVIPATTKSSPLPNPSAISIFGPSAEAEDLYPLSFSDISTPKSSPIVIEEEEKKRPHHEFGEYVDPLPDPDTEVVDNDVFAPEHVRIVLKPPWTQRPQEYFHRISHSSGRPLVPTLPIKASKKFYLSLTPPGWLLPHEEDPQPYPVIQSAFSPKSYSQDVYGLPGFGHHLESAEEAPVNLGELIALLGCRDKDPSICSKITDESCLSRPGYYSKLCPVKCRNCNGLQCLDSIKINCDKVRRLGGCKLPMAGEYCPKTCRLCALPARIAESLPPCKDELDTCENLAESGVCDHPYSKKALRTYCAKSCGHCRESQYYMNDAMYRRMPRKKQKKPTKMPLG